MKICYFLSSEEHGPRGLVAQARAAEQAGFEALWISDHYHPWNDEQGQRIVVASFAGAKGHPAWYLNLSDRQANPEVLCKVAGKAYWSVPEILDGDEYAKVWAQLTADRAWYDDYLVLVYDEHSVLQTILTRRVVLSS